MKSLGYDETNLDYEKSFQIQFGHKKENIESDMADAKPRLDISS